MKLNSHNEWDRLRAVVVGSIDAFSPPLEAQQGGRDVLASALAVAKKAYPEWYLAEMAEDLEDLCALLRGAGVTVFRPSWTESSDYFHTPNWAASGHDLYNVRDLHAVVGNTLIASASASRPRLYETYGLQQIFYDHFFSEGFRWVSAPTPRLRGTYVHELDRSPDALEATEDALHQRLSRGLSEVFHRLDDHEIIFDAANVIRLGSDVLYLVSSTGNRKAAAWLQHTLGSDYRVHITHRYRSSHLDSTVIPLRQGTVLLNGARVNDDTCPEVLKDWEKIYFTEVEPVPDAELKFHQEVRLPAYHALCSMGVSSALNHISSAWAGLNVFSLDPETVLVHDRQTGLRKALESKGFTVVPVRMRHPYTMLGGLHCATLDVVRQSAA